MSVRTDCRHFIGRSTAGGERIERCRIDANEVDPFACPEGCLFFEPRKVSDVGWQIKDPEGDDGPRR
ncbi:MAG: hypothetical protein ACR2H3_12570 [Acidimicrobiales bacterium]